MEDNQIQKEIQSQNQLSNDEIISWGQLLSEAKDTLTKANVPDADIDAWLLMEHCFSITKSFFFLNRRTGNINCREDTALRQLSV